MNLNLCNFIEFRKSLRTDQCEKLKAEQYKRKYQDYLECLAKVCSKLESVQEDQHEKVEEEKLTKEEREIIEIRQYNLSNKLNKEKQQMLKAARGGPLQTMDLSQNFINIAFITKNPTVISEIVRISKLITLNLSFNEICDESLEQLTKGLRLQDSRFLPGLKLQNLNLRGNRLTSESYNSLLPFFQHLKTIDLSENDLRDAFFRNLFLAVEDPLVFRLQSLTLQICHLTERSISLVTKELKHFPYMEILDCSLNDIDQQSDAIVLFHQRILERKKHKMFEELIPQKPFQMHPKLSTVKYHLPKELLLNDLNELSSLKYVVENTKWVINNRVLTLKQSHMQRMFGSSASQMMIPKLLNLVDSSIFNLSKHTGHYQSDLLSVLPLEVTSMQFQLVQTFRDRLMKSNITYFDISDNNFDEQTLCRAIDLLKLCSHKLKVLRLGGNLLGITPLRSLIDALKLTGIESLEVLSMSNSGLKCTCQGDKEDAQCQVKLICTELLPFLSSLLHLDLSFNPDLNVTKHLLEVLPLCNQRLRSLVLTASCFKLDEMKQIKKCLKQMPNLINLELLHQPIIYNPFTSTYVENKILGQMNEANKDKLKGLGSKDQILELNYCVLNDNPIKCMKDVIFFLVQQNISIQQICNYHSGDQFIMIPASQDFHIPPCSLKLVKKDIVSLEKGNTRFNIYEPFEVSVVDWFKYRSNYSSISRLSLSMLLLDFYSHNQSSRLIHPSQLVIVNEIKDDQAIVKKLKLLPFETVLKYQDKEIEEDDDESDLVRALKLVRETEFCDQSKKVKLYLSLSIWNKVLTLKEKSDGNAGGTEYYDLSGRLLRALKAKEEDRGLYSQENLQRMIILMTIIDDIFEVRPHFKKRHDEKDHKAMERTIDKYLMKFYLKLSEEREDVQNDESADRLYLRVINMLN